VDNNALNPDVNSLRQTVHVTLQFDGVAFVPDNLYDALDAQYPTVASDKSTMSRGCYIFNIST
jgi:hypothetical protein